MEDGEVLTPICTGVRFNYDSPEELSLEFSDSYVAGESVFKLVDLLEQSVSSGKSVELGKYNIRVNAIAPGFNNSELSKFIPKDMFTYINNQMPLGRFGEPIEVGALAVFFASPAAAQITGTVQVIDGGYILSC